MAKDPVCGMDVKESGAHHKVFHDGKSYYFCSDQCKQEFHKDPNRYATKSETERPEKKYGT